LRADWRQEWEAELRHREALLTEWERLNWLNKLDLLFRSTSAFWDALWLQPKRLEDEMFQDLRFGVRMLLKHKGLAAVAVLSLGVGMGANVAIFSLTEAFLWRGLPAADHDRLFTVIRGDGSGQPLSYPDYLDYRDRNHVFSGIAAIDRATLAFGNGEGSEVVVGEFVTGNYFDVLGVSMAQGRAFSLEEDRTPGASPVTVVSYDFWQRRFGGDPQLVGKKITFNNQSFTVIGITAAGFVGAFVPTRAEVWVPMTMRALGKPGDTPELSDRQLALLSAIAQLKAEVSPAQAEAELETINRQLQQSYPAPNRFNPDAWAFQQSRRLWLAPVQGTIFRNLRRMTAVAATLATAVASLVLLIACANVANLLLARGAARQKEMAIRLAVGASRARLIRQLLTESLLLAVASGMAGLFLSYIIIQLFIAYMPSNAWSLSTADLRAYFRPGVSALGYMLLLSILTSLFFGLVPALATTKHTLVSKLKDEGIGGRQRFALRNLLVVAQVALSLMLLVCAGLFIRSLRNVQGINPGFDTRHGLVMTIDLGMLLYSEERVPHFQEQLVERLNHVPGVIGVTLADYFPLVGGQWNGLPIAIEGQPPPANNQPMAAVQRVDSRYFETMGIPLLSGRSFTAADTASSEHTVIVNRTLARRYWPNAKQLGDLLGQRIRVGPYQLIIVGVAGDGKYLRLGETQREGIWVPLAQANRAAFQVVVRTTAETPAIVSAIRREVAALDPNLPIQDLRTLREKVAELLWPTRLGVAFVTVLGGLGMLLAAIGLYGVMSYAVVQRTREIGVRMALGAQAHNLLGIVVGDGMRLTIIGMVMGLAGAWAVTRLLASLLYEVSASDPLTFAGVPLVLAAVAWLACYLPARHATKVDPLAALRHE
jgi:putative ABC transport system permease protein